MKSIITTYPDFQGLPRGVKMMLLTSESLFFSEVKSPPAYPRPAHQSDGSGSVNAPKTDSTTDGFNLQQR